MERSLRAKSVCGIVTLLLAVAGMVWGTMADDALVKGFRAPPLVAKPQVWWHWMNGNVTKEGITADLESMARVGIGGVFIFDVTTGIPEGPVAFGSDRWMEMLRHAEAEARRLGLAVGLSNCSGWSSSGGPWVKPADSMKSVVWTETPVAGGRRFEGTLPAPPDPHGFCRDIAVLAMLRPAAEKIDPVAYGMEATATFAGAMPAGTNRLAALRACRDIPDGFNLRQPDPGGMPNIATFTFRKPFPLSGIRLSLDTPDRHEMTFVDTEISEDGKTFRPPVRHRVHLSIYGDKDNRDVFLPCPLANARAVRVRFQLSRSWHKLWNLRPVATAGIPDFKAKTFGLRSDIPDTPYEVRSDQVVPRGDILDLTDRMKPDGSLDWQAPAGDWVVFRFAYAANGAYPRPASKGGAGLEVDKLSATAVERFFDGYMGRAIRLFGPRKPFPETGFNNALIDSFEVGCQNWTDGFEKVFRLRKGYDIVPYLPILTGRIVGGRDETERVLADFRRVISDLFIEGYAETFARLCHANGLFFSLEGYGNAPCDDLKYARTSDCTMGEFWAADDLRLGNAHFGGSIANVWGGGRIASAEAFTSGPTARWTKDPASLKAQGDRVWCAGINQVVYHSYPHQPWLHPATEPGMTMGPYGTQLGRTVTWWEQSGAWHGYQARCQFLLQQGVISGDVLIYNGDAAPNYGVDVHRWHDYAKVKPAPTGYRWDVCGADAVEKMRVADGEIVVPSGARYGLLFLPRSVRHLSSEALSELERLAVAGAPIAAEGAPPRLLGRDTRACSEEAFNARAAALWRRLVPGDCATALKAVKRSPNFDCLTPASADSIRWIHRIAADGSDLYFVALPNKERTAVEVSFRAAGRVPELWNPETGEIARCQMFREVEGRTVMPLTFDPMGATFVLFRPVPTTGIAPVATLRTLSAKPVEGPWEVTFLNGRGAPEKATFNALVSWTERHESDIRHYSGTALYKKRVAVPAAARVMLDLGVVKNLVDVKVNGVSYPTLWKPPFAVDITDAVKGRSMAEVELKVTNLWPNRLIGDDALPPNAEYDAGGGVKTIPGWVWQGAPSPSGRHTFATWRHWKKDEPLLPSGLIGPVWIKSCEPATK